MSLFLSAVLMAAMATVLASAAGSAVAVAWLRARPAGRGALGVAAVATLALPGFLLANAWLSLTAGWRLSSAPGSGPWTVALVAAILALQYWPLTSILAVGAAAAIDPALLEIDPRLRGIRLLRRVVWPAVRPATAVAAAVTFSLVLSNFTVPVLFQVPVFTEVMWVRFNTRLDSRGALVSALPLLAVSLALVVALRGRTVPWPRRDRVAPAPAWRNSFAGWGAAAGTAACGVVFLSLPLPLLDLLLRSRTWRELPGALAAGGPALVNSLLLATGAAGVCLFLGVLFAGTGRGGHRTPRASWLLFLAPGLLLGIIAIPLLNRPYLRWLYPGLAVPGVALSLRHLAPAWGATAAALGAADPGWADVVRDAGGGWRDVWRLALLPGAGRFLAATAYAVYLLCLWDVETVVLLAPPGGETLALRIFNLLHYGHASQVHALCLVMLGLALAPGLAWACVRPFLGGRRPAVGMFAAVLAAAVAGCRPVSDAARAPLDGVTFSSVEVIGGRGVSPGRFNKPRSVVCDRNDNLYVADLTGRIQRFTPEGRFVLQWQMPETDLGKPKGLGIDPEGNIIVVEPHYMRINHFTADGALVAQWGRRGTNAGEFILPRGVAIGPGGDYFISEYTVVDRVQRFAGGVPRDGTVPRLLAAWGGPGLEPGSFNRAENLDVDAEGRVYVADSCNHRIQVFTPEGKFLRSHGGAGSNPGQFSYPYDVRVDSQGTQFVCEFGNSRITVLDARDQVVETVGRPGPAPGEFANPWSVALDSRGNLYVADSQNHRVQKLVRRRPLPNPGHAG